MKQHLFFMAIAVLFSLPSYAQITNNIQLPTSINNDGAAPDASAQLEVKSTTQGMLTPRMTTAQRNAINSPATGLLVFDTTTNSFWFYNGTVWTDLSAADADWSSSPHGIYHNTSNVAINDIGAYQNYNLYVNYDGYGINKAGIYAFRQGSSTAANGGVTWADIGVDAAIRARSNWGNNYSAAVYGASNLDYVNSAAVIGTDDQADIYGALGYKDGNGALFAGYFKGNVNVNGSINMVDGSEGAGKVLTSDANGKASWQNVPNDADWIETNNGFYINDNLGVNSQPVSFYDLYILRDSPSFGGGVANINAVRVGGPLAANGGVNWENNLVDAAIKGDSFYGNSYSAGVYGASSLDFNNSAAVLGAQSTATVFGALSYKDNNGGLYGGYFKGPIRVKQIASSTALLMEHTNTNDYWRLGTNTNDLDLDFNYNTVLKSYISDIDGAYNQASDRSLKNGIEYLEDILPKLSQLKPAKYYYNSAPDAPQKSHGFIAQEVQAIFPELVREKEGKLSLAYDDFAVLAVQAIKEQQGVIEAQNAKIEAQVQQNAELEQRLEKLEALLLGKE